MTNAFEEEVSLLSTLSPNELAEWILAYIKYGSSAPIRAGLGDKPAQVVLPALIKQMEIMKTPPERIFAFQAAILHSCQQLLFEFNADDPPEFFISLLRIIENVPFYDAADFLVDLSLQERSYMDRVMWGNFTLRAHLIRIVLSFPLNTETDKELVEKISLLCRYHIHDIYCAHFCYTRLWKLSHSDGFRYLPELIIAGMKNQNIDVSDTLNQFLRTFQCLELAEHLIEPFNRLTRMKEQVIPALTALTPWQTLIKLICSTTPFGLNLPTYRPEALTIFSKDNPREEILLNWRIPIEELEEHRTKLTNSMVDSVDDLGTLLTFEFSDETLRKCFNPTLNMGISPDEFIENTCLDVLSSFSGYKKQTSSFLEA